MNRPRVPIVLLALAAAGAAGAAAPTAEDLACRAQRSGSAALVVELYTSEGCSSCPPADRWLSRLAARPDVVALAFHVDYWDRLGWKDRHARAAYTQRQAEQRRVNGARFSYTPQVVIDGRDRPDWPGLAALPAPAAGRGAPELTLRREHDRYVATVRAGAGAGALSAYWAVTESGHDSTVTAGENVGTTLRHDAVVREWLPVAPFDASRPATLDFRPATPADPDRQREVVFVLTDAGSGRPVQALKLGC